MESSSATGLEEIARGRWQWKSNSDPWSKSEEPQWRSYSIKENYLIEKAYSEQQKEVDLGDYIVEIRNKVQRKKGAISSQRPIRRVDQMKDVEEMERSERYFETELPKTINKVFGSLEHFMKFFSKRSPEILEFTNQFNELEKSNDLNGLHEKILPLFVRCLEEELLKSLEKQLNNNSISSVKRKILLKTKKLNEELISLFKMQFSSFGEFYGQILKAYTMSTDLYRNLNAHLRNEDWVKLENLLPYAVCLSKAFFNQNMNQNQIEENQAPPEYITLYRGTAFEKRATSLYKDPKNQNFSWYSITSTSESFQEAEKFMYNSVDLEKKKYPVMFIIEVPVTNSEYSRWINVQPYSVKPKEAEIILAPGSVFELGEVTTDPKKEVTTIKIRLKKEVKSLASQGLVMHGALQNEMITERAMKIMCLEGEELSEALKAIEGNKFIDEVEFCLCQFDHQTLKEMMQVLPTIASTKGVKFVSCLYEEKGDDSKCKECEKLDVSKLEISGRHDFYKPLFCTISQWVSLKDLYIDFTASIKATDEEIQNLCSQGLQYLTKLTSLNLKFSWCEQLTDKGMNYLASHGLKYLTQLASLNLDFSWCRQITDEAMNHLASQGLKYLVKLTSLNLDITRCLKVTDQGMHNLAFQGLKCLSQLRSLNLNILRCDGITNEGMNYLASQGLKSLTQLTSLTLSFSSNKKIGNTGVNYLASQGLQYLTQLRSLDLYFAVCSEITDEGIENLTFEGLQYLVELTSLNLRFEFCRQITDEGMDILSQGLRNLSKLTSLSMNFIKSAGLTDEGVNYLASQGLKYLTQLVSLTLDFFDCLNITDVGVHHLTSQQLQDLTQLKFLKLNFKECYGITERGRDNLASFNQKYRTPLAPPNRDYKYSLQAWNSKNNRALREAFRDQQLNIFCRRPPKDEKEDLILLSENRDFNDPLELDQPQLDELLTMMQDSRSQPNERPDFWIRSPLENPQIVELSQLKSLEISLVEISDEAMDILDFQRFKHLTQMTSLIITLPSSLTDEGVYYLATRGLQYLSQLSYLNLDFTRCENLKDEGMMILACEGLQHLTQLERLRLSFQECSQITDTGVSYLTSKGLRSLTQLKYLVLSFRGCRQITDDGVLSLTSHGLKNFPQLTVLCLDFSGCVEVTDEGVNHLVSQGIKYCSQLISLNLDFVECVNITSFTMKNLARVLRYFGFIMNAYLP